MIPLSLLAIGAVAFVWMRRATRARAAAIDPERRSFLTGAGAGAGAALAAVASGPQALRRARARPRRGQPGLAPDRHQDPAPARYTDPNPRAEWKGTRVESYRRLGRTGLQVSDISLGTGAHQGRERRAIVREAIERGVNYFDTAPDYSARAASRRSAAR